MAANGKEAHRTVSFFRLTADVPGQSLPAPFPHKPWQKFLGNVAKMKLVERTWQSPTRRLIGEVLTVDQDYALKLMEPRDEDSWLELLKQEAAAEPLNLTNGELVETTIVVFLSEKNLFGIIRGSTASPSHSAVAEWLSNISVAGKKIVLEGSLHAEAALSKSQKQRLASAGGVAMATVRVSTDKASQLQQAGSTIIGDTLKNLRQTYGDLMVTVTMRVPQGKGEAKDSARQLLKAEAERLQGLTGVVESASATLVNYDAESRARTEEVDFLSDRITAKTRVPLIGSDGTSIRNASAVRAILQAAYNLNKELSSVD